jgi:hypothetical protein
MSSFVTVYVDWGARQDDVHAAINALPKPVGVSDIAIVATSDTLGYRTVVDLTGAFEDGAHGRHVARSYAIALSDALGLPALALSDLIVAGQSDW